MAKYMQILVNTPHGARLEGKILEYEEERLQSAVRHLQPLLTGGGLSLDADDGVFLVPEYLLQRSHIHIIVWEEDVNP